MNDAVASIEKEPGPSWARPNWPLAELDELNLGLDPTQATIEKVKAAVAERAGQTSSDPEAIRRAAEDSIRAMMLIRTYRVRGHLAADLDPLRLTRREVPADLTAEYHGFSDDDLDRPIWLCGALGFEQATVREIVRVLQRNYCGHVGLEYMHINEVEERRFLQERMEGKDAEIQFTPEGKQSILTKVIHAEQWEKFLARKYVGTKRFGLDGGEGAVPALEAVIKYGGQMRVTEIDVGMSHRGRLNILCNVMGKPAQAIFHEFAGGATNPADVGGSGDVKYHLGTSSDREFDGNKVHLSLLPNPSHLEAVDPVVLGKVRAVQTIRGDVRGKTVLPILLHGDAAFAAQGVVWECLSFSGLPGYGTGGTIHFIINNQVGFTTSPQFGRSSPYPSDVAKGIQAPILHVNGDDPEAVTFCCKLATEFRQTFGRDIVIDMWCYRRFGHNEGDEPSFTQPLMYAAIKQHPPVSAIYGKRLIEEGVVDQAWIERATQDYVAQLEQDFQSAVSYLPNKADWFEGRWAGLGRPDEPVLARRNTATAIAEAEVHRLGDILTTIPEGLQIHKTLQRILDAKKEMFASGEGFDWSTAEALAFGSLLAEGHGVRLSGQDSGRGTFSQRHAVWVDQQTGQKYIPLTTVEGARFEVRDSPLSEFGVLGFEYGYSLADPQTLVLWEAQFGDFANGAQSIIDQFVAAGERPRAAASARLRRAGAGAQLGAARTLFAAQCRGQSPGRQLHDPGQLLPHPAPADAARFPQAAGADDAQIAASTQARGFEGHRLHWRQPFPPHHERPQPAFRGRNPAAGAVLGQARLRADGSARCRRRPRRRDPPHRAALSLPVGAFAQAPEGDAEASGPRLGAGRAEEQWRVAVRRGFARAMPRRRRTRWNAATICRPRRERFAGDGSRQASCGRAGGADRRGARPQLDKQRANGQ
jgi:2-oxoglutarate dehydrogenase E1 component